MRHSLLGLISLAALAAVSVPDALPDRRAQVDAIFEDYDRTDSPGCVVGVYRDGKIEYARGYGMANLELSVALTPQSVLDLLMRFPDQHFSVACLCNLAQTTTGVLEYRNAPSDPLTPTVRDAFAVGPQTLPFSRDAAGRISGFQLGAERVRGISFARLAP